MSWCVVELKNKYSKDTSRKQFYKRLKQFYGICTKNIFMNADSYNEGMNYYVFICTNDKRQLWERLKTDKFVETAFGCNEISDEQMKSMRTGLQGVREQIGFGDIVKLRNGTYNKLYGIVLRQRNDNKFQIGLKFCYGVRVEMKDGNDLQIVGNIFNFLKVKR